MTQELYINGMLADLPDTNLVSLQFVSNILGDISKISGSRSFTISLPKTITNLQIFDDPVSPAHNSRARGRYYDAVYYRNGLKLIEDGKAAILSVKKDTIEVALIFFGLQNLAEFMSDDLKIGDLFTDIDTVVWSRTFPTFSELKTTGRGVARMDTGIDISRIPTLQCPPVVTMKNIFDRIMRKALSETPYSIPSEIMDDMATLAIPFKDFVKIPSEEVFWHQYDFGATMSTRNSRELRLHNPNPMDENPWGDYSWFSGGKTVIVEDGTDTLDLTISFTMPPEAFISGDSSLLIMGVLDGSNVMIDSEPFTYVNNGRSVFYQKKLDIADYTSISFEVTNAKPSGSFVSRGLEHFRAAVSGQRGQVGNALYIGRNLPELKATDIFKFICQFYGLAVVPDNQGGISFVPYDKIRSNMMSYRDWSDKLAGRNLDEEIAEQYFDESGFAQHNLFKWTDSRLPYIPKDGDITVDNETLPIERTIATFPFVAAYRSKYHIFTNPDYTAGTYEIADVAPHIFRILRHYTDSGELSFSGDLQLPYRVAHYYEFYQQIVGKIRRLKVFVALNEQDFRTLDMTKPVYFSQFGHFYAIKTILTDNSSPLSEVELIQI